MKFKWLQDHWLPEELEQAGIWLRNAVSIQPRLFCPSVNTGIYCSQMLSHCQKCYTGRHHSRPHCVLTTASSSFPSAQAQSRGLNLLNTLGSNSRRSITPTPDVSMSEAPQTTAEVFLTGDELAAIEAENLRAVEKEIQRYKGDGLVDSNEALDLIHFWDVSKFIYQKTVFHLTI